jgi:hypothetical protein
MPAARSKHKMSWLPKGVVAALSVGLSACGGADAAAREDPPVRGTRGIDDAVRWERGIQLEENDETINVIVRATLDPRGGFLIADEQEGYVRRYDSNGRLLAQFARKGYGPGEFRNLLRAMRLPDGSIAAFDIFHTAAVFDSTGERLVRTIRTPVAPVHAVHLLTDSILLLGGQVSNGSGTGQLLHLWDLRRDSLLSSFFSPPIPSDAHRVAAATAGWVGMDRRGDTLAVVSSLSDTVYLMSLQGRMLDRIPVPAASFRRLDPDKPLPGARGGIVAAREWLGSFSLMSDVHWLGDTLIVQFQDRRGPEPHWRLVGMTRAGERVFEVVDSPYLLASDKSSGQLYFVDPRSPAPNAWRVGRLH